MGGTKAGVPEPPTREVGEGLPRDERLRARGDFTRCYRRGRRRHAALATLHFVPNGLGHPRMGVTASRKVGGAVARHRVKRRVREIYRRWSRRSQLPPLDLVFHLKPAAAEAPFSELSSDLRRLLEAVLGEGERGRR